MRKNTNDTSNNFNILLPASLSSPAFINIMIPAIILSMLVKQKISVKE